MAEDRRTSQRVEVRQTAYISVAGSSTRCQITNISNEGAALDVPDATFVPATFQLMTESDREIRTCRIVWIMKNKIGIKFEK